MSDEHQDQQDQYEEHDEDQSQQGGLLTEQSLDQQAYDQQFGSIIGQGAVPGQGLMGGPAGGVDWAREYFDQAEQTLRSARRVAEYSAMVHIQQQLVAQTTAAVISQIRRNPQLLR